VRKTIKKVASPVKRNNTSSTDLKSEVGEDSAAFKSQYPPVGAHKSSRKKNKALPFPDVKGSGGEEIMNYGSTDSQDLFEGDVDVETPFLNGETHTTPSSGGGRRGWQGIEPMSMDTMTPEHSKGKMRVNKDGINFPRLWRSVSTIFHCGSLIASLGACYMLYLLTKFINESGKVNEFVQVTVMLMMISFGGFLVFVTGRLLLTDCLDEALVNKICVVTFVVATSLLLLNFLASTFF